MHVPMHVCTYVRMYACTYVPLYVCTYVRMYVCTFAHFAGFLRRFMRVVRMASFSLCQFLGFSRGLGL